LQFNQAITPLQFRVNPILLLQYLHFFGKKTHKTIKRAKFDMTQLLNMHIEDATVLAPKKEEVKA
jgi:hypothetical protein